MQRGGDDPDRDQHEDRAEHGVEEEPQRCLPLLQAAEEHDDHQHRHQHRLVEQVEDHQVAREQRTQHHRLERQHADDELAHARAHLPAAAEDGDGREPGHQHRQPRGEPIGGQAEVDLRAGAPQGEPGDRDRGEPGRRAPGRGRSGAAPSRAISRLSDQAHARAGIDVLAAAESDDQAGEDGSDEQEVEHDLVEDPVADVAAARPGPGQVAAPAS